MQLTQQSKDRKKFKLTVITLFTIVVESVALLKTFDSKRAV